MIGIVLICLFLFFWIDPTGRPSEWQRFAGRMHPAVVHLPIGILVFGFLLTVLRSLSRRESDGWAVNASLLLGGWFGVLAIVAGSWLGQLGGYEPDILFRHKLAGYIVTVASAILLFVRTRVSVERSYARPQFAVWTVVLAALIYGGDLGGRITHGEGFASEYAPGFARLVLGSPTELTDRLSLQNPDVTTVYEGVVDPIFQEKCTSCHGEDRGKGKLRLHNREVIENHKGDDPLIVPGQPDASLLIQRLVLPEGHEDQMPPYLDAKPISPADVDLLKWWIAGGASFELTIADAELPPNIRVILDAYGLGQIKRGIFALDVPLPDSTRIAVLTGQGASVRALADGSPFLSVRCHTASECLSNDALSDLAQHVAWLDASDSDFTDSDLDVLSELNHLTRLDLSNTRVNGSGLAAISSLEHLEYLNLYGTDADDAALGHLESVASLEALYLWQTSVTTDAVERLQTVNPRMRINTGTNGNSNDQ